MGKHITEQLLKAGRFVLTAVARPNSTNKIPEGVKVSRVDYSSDDDTALVEALRGQQVLIITMAVTAPPDTIPKLVRAAAKAGVSYVLPNWFGHDGENDALCRDSWLTPARDTIHAEFAKLEGTSSYIMLACNFWFEFSLGGGPDRFGFDFQKRSLIWFDNGDVSFNLSTWAQCGRAVASLLSLPELPEDAANKRTTLSQFRNTSVYINSFRLNQRDMFDSVKRVTKTTDADWAISHESSEQRFKDATAELQKHNFSQFTKMLYSRMFFPTADGDFKPIHNDVLGLPKEDLDELTSIAVRMGQNGEVAASH
ncbi:hypothetical protein MMC27_008822 [Xylographa pallens]|nr:hypothetical protein [Xylographa pallens]